MRLGDLEALAHDLLRVDLGPGEDGWAFQRVSRDEIEQPGAGTFDRRVHLDVFAGTHLSLRVSREPGGRRVGNMTLFVLHREHFEHVRFWRSLAPAARAVWEKISLGQLLPCAGVSTVVMHGYIEGPSQHRAGRAEASYRGLTASYVRFLIRVAAQCQAQCIPMLIECTGKAALEESRRSKPCLTADDLTVEEIAAIGQARPGSAAVERIARRIGLAEVSGTWNERTLGKVYCSVPQVVSGLGLRARIHARATDLLGGAAAPATRG